jgi:hypothetical protein
MAMLSNVAVSLRAIFRKNLPSDFQVLLLLLLLLLLLYYLMYAKLLLVNHGIKNK